VSEPEYEIAAPRADAMIQSLRAFGYDVPAAIADLIDNSIAAGAKNVWLEFYWSGAESYVAIADDGAGMTEGELSAAMRPGSRSPLEERDAKDLGRFGLGLKTASFSQCLSLTVASRKKAAGAAAAVRCWDLEYVTECGDWRLLCGGSETFRAHGLARLEALPSGTVVFWEKMDRVTPPGTQTNSSPEHDLFLRRIEEVRAHIAMVFHRYLDGIPGRPLRIHVNGELVKAWDPFAAKHSATQHLPEEAMPFRGEALMVRPFILPHHSKMSKAAYEEAKGPKGWDAQQGFYVYRNKRLLVAGDWLGFFQKEQHCKLARIQVDIPNSMDETWEIDVKKSRAWPPPQLRRHLRRPASATRARATEVYRNRGA